MSAERFVVLGLAPARSPWFAAVGRWAHAGSVPLEFVKCVSTEQVRARLSSGRRYSAVLVDAAAPGVDRDLLSSSRDRGAVPLVVDDRRTAAHWVGLGAAAVLAGSFGPAALLDALVGHAEMVGGDDSWASEPARPPEVRRRHGELVMVCGTGGTGTSTLAVALAQGFATRRSRGAVLLADFKLRGEQAMLHDVGDTGPGVQELVEHHRNGMPGDDEVRALSYDVAARGYHLLLGLRRPRAWSTLRPRSVQAAVESLTSAYGRVVVDSDADLEGQADSGSADVEERHVLARTAAGAASLVLAVGLPGMKGTYALARLVDELLCAEIPPFRIVPVVNRAPRAGRARGRLTRALQQLVGPQVPLPAALFVPERTEVDRALRDGTRLPTALAASLANDVRARLDAVGRREDTLARPIAPGSLATWEDEEVTVG